MKRIARYSEIMFLLILMWAGTAAADDAMDRYHHGMAAGYEDAVAVGTTDDSPARGDDAILDGYLRLAARSNPALEAAFLRWKAALETVPQARSLPDPRLSYAYYLTNVETRVGPQRHKVDLSQMLPWFGTRRLRGEVSMKNADIAWQAFQERKLKLYHDVRTAYYDLYYLARSLEIIRQNMVLLGSIEEVVRTRYATGTARHGDLVKVQVELGKLEERLLSMEDARPSLTARLNAVLNRPADAEVPWPESLPGEELAISEETLIAHMFERNPGLSTLEGVREREQRATELAGKAFYPSVTVGVSWIETGDARMPGVDESGKDPFMPMISVNLPLFRGTYHAAVNEAAFREQAADRMLRDRTNAVIADLKLILYKYRDAERKVSLYHDSLIPKGREALAVALAGFKSDGTDFLSLIDSQRTLLEFELACEQAIASRATALAGIELLAGGALDAND